jgi:2-oxoglutarate dehydrogenase E2 component (dihydrolipoamide succinyltransferase)
MPTTVTMPQLGETVTEGTILRWAKKVGDSIAADEVLVEISTDKVDTEVPSPAAGVVQEILVAEGQTVAVGSPLVVIGDAVGQPAVAATTPAPPAPSPVPIPASPPPPPAVAPASVATGAKTPAPAPTVRGPAAAREVLSPVVRKLIREHAIDLAEVTGTGDGGRITRRDIEAYLERRQAAPPEPVAAASAPEPVIPAPPPPAPAPSPALAPPSHAPAPSPPPTAASISPPAPVVGAGSEEVALDRLRVRIGENMIRAKQTAAHVWTSVEVDYERIELVRSSHQEAFKRDEGFSLTYLPFIARATIDALTAYPVVNSSLFLEEKKAMFHKGVNLGIAIDLNQKGLIVASIRNADGLRLVGLARKIRDLAERARAGKLEPDDVAGSTFTITNPGPYGSFMSAPVINVPNVGILSTDTVTKRPAVVVSPEGQDTIGIRHIGYLGLSWDHRAFDGSTAVLFLQRIRQNLERWDWGQELA